MPTLEYNIPEEKMQKEDKFKEFLIYLKELNGHLKASISLIDAIVDIKTDNIRPHIPFFVTMESALVVGSGAIKSTQKYIEAKLEIIE